MPRTSPEAVKIINHGTSSARRLVAVVGLVTGAIAGAGATTAAFQRSGTVATKAGVTPKAKEGSSDSGALDDGGPVSPFDRDAAGAKTGVKAKLITLGQRRGWAWLGRTMQVQQRFGELQGSNLASAVTLQVFLALFPMLILAAAVIGFLAHGNGDVPGEIIRATGLQGSAAKSLHDTLDSATKSRKAGSAIGLVGLVWSALGISSALQYAYNQTWQATGRGMKDKAVGAGWMAGAAVLLIASAGFSLLVSVLPAQLGILSIAGGIIFSFGLWLFTSKTLPNIAVSWKELVPGAILATVGLEILKILGGVWVPKAAASSSAVYGTVGIVFALLAWVLLFGKLVVYSSILNVVRYEGRHGVNRSIIDAPAGSQPQTGEMTRSGRTETD